MNQSNEVIEDLKTNGFAVVKNFFPKGLVRQAVIEVNELFVAADAGKTNAAVLTANDGRMKILTRLFGESPTLDQMVDKILSAPESSQILRALAGPRIKIRDYTCRKMSGHEDPGTRLAPPLEWHRDAVGEFCIGIYLTDFLPNESPTTGMIPGSHLYPTNPRFQHLIGDRVVPGKWALSTKVSKFFLRFNFFNKWIAHKIEKQVTGAYGEVGDFYLFINDTWHSRLPNLWNHRGMVVQLGAFPIAFEFPANTYPVSDGILGKLPDNFKRAVMEARSPIGDRTDCILTQNLEKQRKFRLGFLPFYFAKTERRIADFVSTLFWRLGFKE